MPGGGAPGRRLDTPVLIAGDAEADLGAIAGVLPVEPGGLAPSLAQGVPAACAALRLAEFAVVVADVTTLDDAFAILRAANRGRPAARVICLLPAAAGADGPLSDHLSRLAFAVRHHPVDGDRLAALVDGARRDFAEERAVVPRRARDGWDAAEQALARALAALARDAEEGAAGSPDAHAIGGAVAAASRAARAMRGADHGPQVLFALATALAPRPDQVTEGAA